MTNNKQQNAVGLLIEQSHKEWGEYKKTMTNNKQLTAVDWLADKIEILHYDYWAEHISKDEKNQRLKQLKEKAKAMHKEEIIKAHGIKFDYSYSQIDPKKITGEQYYNETYGGEL